MLQVIMIIQEPKPYQVVQRCYFDPLYAHCNNPGGPDLGFGVVKVQGITKSKGVRRVEARTVLLDGGCGKEMDWSLLDIQWEGKAFHASMEIPAGGWYRLEMRFLTEDGKIHTGSVEPFGVGEVFLIAGQSYAGLSNDKPFNIEDPQGRITLFDLNKDEWAVANDPSPAEQAASQPNAKIYGTLWPPAMDQLLHFVRVPIGLVNVSVGATAVRQWLPGEPVFDRFLLAGLKLKDFRYILWQQGESDVIEDTSKEVYMDRMKTIKRMLEAQWGFSKPWVLAKSTLHPAYYVFLDREGRIREAIHELCHTNGYLSGPDTDILGGVGINRAEDSASGHLTELGQRNAAMMWFSVLWHYISQNRYDQRSKS